MCSLFEYRLISGFLLDCGWNASWPPGPGSWCVLGHCGLRLVQDKRWCRGRWRSHYRACGCGWEGSVHWIVGQPQSDGPPIQSSVLAECQYIQTVPINDQSRVSWCTLPSWLYFVCFRTDYDSVGVFDEVHLHVIIINSSEFRLPQTLRLCVRAEHKFIYCWWRLQSSCQIPFR